MGKYLLIPKTYCARGICCTESWANNRPPGVAFPLPSLHVCIFSSWQLLAQKGLPRGGRDAQSSSLVAPKSLPSRNQGKAFMSWISTTLDWENRFFGGPNLNLFLFMAWVKEDWPLFLIPPQLLLFLGKEGGKSKAFLPLFQWRASCLTWRNLSAALSVHEVVTQT